MSDRPRIVVVGGGLAGLSAALACADAGGAVTVVERRRRLGGLTWSFRHGGRSIDNGQHVFLRCCTAYLDFLGRIGSASDVELQGRLDVAVVRPAGPDRPPVTARLRRRDLPAPLHLSGSLLRYGHLGWRDRMRLGRAAMPLRTVDLDDPGLDRETFAGYLKRHGQSDRAIDALWELITVATINLPARQASAAMGAKVFQTGLLSDPAAADIGWSRVPLSHLHGDRAGDALKRAGAETLLGERVVAVGRGGGEGGPLQVRTEGRTVAADAVVIAVPHHAIGDVVPPATFAAQGTLDGLGVSPIVNVHIVYDRPVTDLPLAAGIDSPIQWVFDRTASSGRAPPQQYLAVTLSAADAYLGRRPEDLGPEIVAALGDLFPASRGATVVDTLVTKERTATFRAVPGTGALRPGPLTTIPGLVLAGAWTDTGWPATMEGAVRSGLTAARAALAAVGVTAPGRASRTTESTPPRATRPTEHRRLPEEVA